MKALLAKLETLVDEVTGLVREERARRNLAALKADPPPTYIPYVPYQPPHPDLGQMPWWLQGPTCTTTKYPEVEVQAWNGSVDPVCAPMATTGAVWVGETSSLGSQ